MSDDYRRAQPGEEPLPKAVALPEPSQSQRRAMKAQVDAVHDHMADRLMWVVGKLEELIEGVTVVEYSKDGEANVYQKPPNRMAAQYWIDRVAGKPKQTVKHGLEDETKDTLEAWLAERRKELPSLSSMPATALPSLRGEVVQEGEFRAVEEIPGGGEAGGGEGPHTVLSTDLTLEQVVGELRDSRPG